MVSQDEYIKHEGLEIGFYVVLGIIMSIILPLFVGFGLRGFSETFISGRPLVFGDILVTYLIYYILIVAALSAIVFPIMNLLTIRRGEHPATQENPKWWRIFTVSLIHNPEKGALYTLFRKIGMGRRKNIVRWTLSILNMMVVGTLVFGALGALSLTVPEAQIVGIPVGFQQQITPFTDVIFTAEPPAFSETGTMLFVFMLLMGIVAYFTARFGLGIAFFFAVGFIIISPLIGFGWLGFHNIVYSASDQARFATFLFGWLGSSMTLAFGTFILWYLWHFWNNIFAKLREIAPANEDVVFISWLAWGILLFGYIVVSFIVWRFGKKKKGLEGVPEPNY